MNFVDSVWELFGPLLAGTPSVLLSHKPEEDIDGFAREVSRHRASRLVMIPSLLHVLLAGESDSSAWRKDLQSVTHWTTSGEALSADLANRFHQSFRWATLLNLYGMSEAAADSLAATISVRTLEQRAPIGRPIANTQAYVLDSSFQPLPLGAVGEVYLGGAGLARGYRGDAPRTAERFVPAPFSAQEGRRLYRTGDRARARDDGKLEFLGRLDDQVKLRGQRVELKEIEAALNRQRGVAQAVVMVCKNADGSDGLVAFVRPTAEFSRWDLRKSLTDELPRHMIPHAIFERDYFPVTATGKLDRRRLASEYGDSIPPTSTFEAPTGRVESLVARIWRGVLGVEQVGRHDTLLDLGGNSLSALRIVSRVARELGVTLNPNEALHHTLSQFATACTRFAQGHTEG